MNKVLEAEPTKLRSSVCFSESRPQIDRNGGRYKSGIIRGASLIAVGEALGHGMFIDEVFLSQVAESINGRSSVKVRYTHPDMSGDGLATHIGRAYDARVVGEHVEADIHFTKAGRNKPDGDLGGDVMDQAEETPEDFGISIVFTEDYESSRDFIEDHSEDGRFESPHARNENNYPHVRLEACNAADFVGDPAANGNGVFFRDGQELPAELERMLSYAIGISDEPATCKTFSNVSPERAKGFVTRFLSSHGLQINEVEAMAKKETPKVEEPAKAAPQEKPLADPGKDDPNVSRSPDGLGPTKPGDCGNGFSEDNPATREQLEKAFISDKASDTQKKFAQEFCKESLYAGLTIEEARTEFTAALMDRLEAAEQLASAGKADGEDEPAASAPESVNLSKRQLSPAEKYEALNGRN